MLNVCLPDRLWVIAMLSVHVIYKGLLCKVLCLNCFDPTILLGVLLLRAPFCRLGNSHGDVGAAQTGVAIFREWAFLEGRHWAEPENGQSGEESQRNYNTRKAPRLPLKHFLLALGSVANHWLWQVW